MRLSYLSIKNLTPGRLVVLLGPPGRLEGPRLRIVETKDENAIYLLPASLLFDEDDRRESVPLSQSLQRLRGLEIEVGDRIVFRNRPGRVVRAIPNDLHVYVQLDEESDNELYTNLIHLDFSPSLNALDDASSD